MLLGLWIAVVPILGLPASWKSSIIIVSGLLVALLAATRKSNQNSNNKVVILDSLEVAPSKKIRKPRSIKQQVSFTLPDTIPDPDPKSERVPEQKVIINSVPLNGSPILSTYEVLQKDNV